MKSYIIVVGLFDKDTKQQEMTSVEAYKLVNRLVVARTGAGTISEAFGVYTHENGAVVIEPSLRIEINGDGISESVDALISDLKRVLNQESVMLEVRESTIKFK